MQWSRCVNMLIVRVTDLNAAAGQLVGVGIANLANEYRGASSIASDFARRAWLWLACELQTLP